MAGLRGNQAYLLSGEQTEGKGKPVKKWSDKNYFSSNASISPTQTIGQLAETDATRNAGENYVQQTAAEGAPQFYVRPDSIHHWLYYALGSITNAGAAGEFTHKSEPAQTLPYITVGRAIGATLFEQFNDCMVSDLTISAGTASPLTATATIMGLAAVRQTEEWKTELAPPAASALAPLNYNQAEVKIGGTETRLVSSFNTQISNNVTMQQTDASIPYDVVPGTFAVTLGFDMIFENLKEYNKFYYGGESGTAQSSTLFTTSAEFKFEVSSKLFLKLTYPKIAYTAFPVDPDPGGAPVVASVTAAAQRGTEPFIKTEVENTIEK